MIYFLLHKPENKLSKTILYVCTFGRGVAGKDTMWYQEEKSTLETTEVSDASSHYMSG